MGLQEAHNLSDVQRFYIVMAPTSRKGAPLRLAAVGKKQLPQTRDRFWACIQGLGQEVRGRACMHPRLDGATEAVNETQHWCSTLGKTDT